MATLLEKVQSLQAYLSVNSTAIDTVLALGIDKIILREQQRLLNLQVTLATELADFEKHYQMCSTDFYARYQQGVLGDEMDFMEWAASVEMLQKINQQLALLSGHNSESNH